MEEYGTTNPCLALAKMLVAFINAVLNLHDPDSPEDKIRIFTRYPYVPGWIPFFLIYPSTDLQRVVTP
jgi:hypothetical protein